MKHLTADQKGSGALCFSHSTALSRLNVPNGKTTRVAKYVSHTPKRVECGGVIIPQATWGFQWVKAMKATVCHV